MSTKPACSRFSKLSRRAGLPLMSSPQAGVGVEQGRGAEIDPQRALPQRRALRQGEEEILAVHAVRAFKKVALPQPDIGQRHIEAACFGRRCRDRLCWRLLCQRVFAPRLPGCPLFPALARGVDPACFAVGKGGLHIVRLIGRDLDRFARMRGGCRPCSARRARCAGWPGWYLRAGRPGWLGP